MFDPNNPAESARSGEIAPFQAKYAGELTLPDCDRLGVLAVEISYQRSSAPAPPNTVWAVQIAVAPSRGSTAATACSRRVSSVSRTTVVPRCGASAGTEYAVTPIAVAPLITALPELS